MAPQFDNVYRVESSDLLSPGFHFEDADAEVARDKASPFGLSEEAIITKAETSFYKCFGQPTRGDPFVLEFFEVIGDLTSNKEFVTCGIEVFDKEEVECD